MWLSDVSVKRPVLATVINALLVVFGLMAMQSLTVREYPNIDSPVVSVSTSYPGASAAVVESQVTQILEDRIAGIEGIERINSSSTDGESQISIEFSLKREVDDAANDVRDRVSRALGNLPDQADPPEVSKADADARPVVWLVLSSDRLDRLELADYAARYLEDRFATLDGVAQVRLGGDQRKAMRIWLDSRALASRGLTVDDIEAALGSENLERPAGTLESLQRRLSLRTERSYRSADDFAQMVVGRGADGHPIRLAQVARVEIGAEDPHSAFRGNGVNALGIGLVRQSTANTLDVARAARQLVKQLNTELPQGMRLQVNYDSAVFIEASLHEVEMALLFAAVAVIAVIWLFLGSWRATLIPALTVPISLVASFIALQSFGFSINILTLLAMVLAVGLVVDDAIVVVENIHRRLELGEPPLLAAYLGTREVGFAVIATTAVLVAVLAPIAMLDGDIGRLFGEFALALAGSVVCSAVVALTLAPVLASRLLRPAPPASPGHSATAFIDTLFAALERRYHASLARSLRWRLAAPLLILSVLGGGWLLLEQLPRELGPAEDRGGFFVHVVGAPGASFDSTLDSVSQVEAQVLDRSRYPEVARAMLRVPGFRGNDVNQGTLVVSTTDWSERSRSSAELARAINDELGDLTDAQVFIQQRSGLSGGFGQPVEVILGGPSYEELSRWQAQLLPLLAQIPGLQRIDSSFKETQPQLRVIIDHERAAALGISTASIARALETVFGSRRVTTWEDRGEEYEVMLQAPAVDRQDPTRLQDVHVRSADGSLVALTNLVRFEERASAPAFTRVDRMRAITFTAALAPDYALGDALDAITALIRAELPETARISFGGESRDFRDASSALYFSFAMALLIVYLVLAAQFESFVHPLVILTTVPLALFGALLGLWLAGMSMNIYAQIGLIMLVGLAAKNGILIVEFVNQRRDAGMRFDEAVLDASRVRLRPILMTSVATVAGAVPLMLATGAGAEARAILGVVIFAGVGLSTALTLYVVPALYRLLCRSTGSPGRHAAQLGSELQQRHDDAAHALIPGAADSDRSAAPRNSL